MSEADKEFDDPALKSAIRRAMGSERAPAGLDARISAALAADKRPPIWRSTRVRIYALAALLLIAIGVGVILITQRSEPPVPDWFADAMITTHDTCTALADHRLITTVQQDDVDALRTRLQEMLGHPALVAMLGDGWQFKGAGLCQVNHVPAGHLLFANGDDTLSIFSISANLLYSGGSRDGMVYSQTRNGYELAGFVYNGAVHCLVAQSPTHQTTLRQVITMRDRLRTNPTTFGPERRSLNIARPDQAVPQ